ncbi:MAG: hypothetical protein KC561_17350, partial [Myxococcales bacterium]|nr:hypothetical protein [Myxococcales bacterium]
SWNEVSVSVSDPEGGNLTPIWQITAPNGFDYGRLQYPNAQRTLRFFADVSGLYTVTATVENSFGSDSCTTQLQTTTSDLIRIELLWNVDHDEQAFGPDCTDVDLHLLRMPEGPFSYGTEDDCFYGNCATCTISYNSSSRELECRDAIEAAVENCAEDGVCPAPNEDMNWSGDVEEQPRLDLDDVDGRGPENINVRAPEPGTYRLAAHLYGAGYKAAQAVESNGQLCGDITIAQAEVRIFCQGAAEWESEIVPLRFCGSRINSSFWEIGEIIVAEHEGALSCDDITFHEYGEEGDRVICAQGSGKTNGCSAQEITDFQGQTCDP